MPSTNKLISETYEVAHKRRASFKLRLTIDVGTQRITIAKVGHTNDASGKHYGFVNTNPDVLIYVGEIIADAGKLANKRLTELEEATNGNAKKTK